MRERSTWNRNEIAKKAAAQDGDVYSMNQDHPQPAMDEYVIGDSSDFAEDVHSPNTWEQEYSGGQVARNEIGFPEMRKDTFNHSEKTASERVRLKKAELCVAVAKLMLGGKRVASQDAVEDQAVALMYMPDQELISTHMRLAEEQDADDDEDEEPEEDDEGGQEKQAADDDDGDEDDDDGGQQKQADQDGAFEEDDDEGQTKQAQDQAPDDVENEGGDQNAKANQNKQARMIARLKRAMGEQQQLLSQIQQELQQQGQQQQQLDQVSQQQQQLDQVSQQQQQLNQLSQQQLPVDEQQVAQGDLDQLLADQDCGPMAEEDIQMDAPPMDVGQTVLAGEDEILRTLFAQDQDDDDADADDGKPKKGEVPPQFQKKEARTASTRTVGTRPRQGVARLGGSSMSKSASQSVTDKLSSLWQSAPDVRDAFGLK